MPKQPERITEADLDAAIGREPIWDGDADDVIELAVQEMGQRMSDPIRRGDVPDHVLIKFLAEANKSADRRLAERERAQLEQAQQDEIEVIVQSALPPEKKRALLEAALTRLDKRRQQIVDLIEGDSSE